MSNPAPDLKEFIDKYIARFGGTTVHSTAANWYPVVYMLADVIEKAGSTDKDAIIAQLNQVKDYHTFTRTLTTDYRRDMVHEANIFRIEGAKTHQIDSATVPIKFKNGDHN